MIVGDTEAEFALLGAQDDGLSVHAADHVERSLGFAAQGQLQKVVLNAGLEGLAQPGLDGEEAVGRTQPFDALMRALMVIVFDPEFDALAGILEAAKLGADQKILPEGGPEALDLAQRHGVMRPGRDVGHAILPELGGKAAGAAPGDILAAVVGEHLARRLELGDGHAIDLDDRLGRGTAKQIGADHVAGMIIEEGDEVGITAAQPEGENVRLPHLVGRGPLEETGPGHVAALLARRGRHEVSLLQALAHGAGTGRQQEPPAQDLRNAGDAEGGVLPFDGQDLIGDGGGQFGLARQRRRPGGQAGGTLQLVVMHPFAQAHLAHGQLATDPALRMAALQVQLHGLEFELRSIALALEPGFFFARTPHGGFSSFFSLWFSVLWLHVTLHSFHWSVTPFPPHTGLINWSMGHIPVAISTKRCGSRVTRPSGQVTSSSQ